MKIGTTRRLLLALSVLPLGLAAQEPTVLHCGRLIDGVGNDARANVDVLVRDNRIERIGTSLDIPPGAREVDLRDRTCLPGLIDTHVHLVHTSILEASSGDKALNALHNAQTMLQYGFTTIRTVGSRDAYYVDADVRDAIARGDFEGPRMFVAPHMLSNRG